MNAEIPWYEDVAIPALLRHARGSYGEAIHAALAEAEFEDVPRNGPWVLGGLMRTELPLSTIVADLGTTKQSTSQLIDTLVIRGYLEREVDPADRRRMIVSLTSRGRAAAIAIGEAVAAVDLKLKERISAEQEAGLRAGLAALAEIRAERR